MKMTDLNSGKGSKFSILSIIFIGSTFTLLNVFMSIGVLYLIIVAAIVFLGLTVFNVEPRKSVNRLKYYQRESRLGLRGHYLNQFDIFETQNLKGLDKELEQDKE